MLLVGISVSVNRNVLYLEITYLAPPIDQRSSIVSTSLRVTVSFISWNNFPQLHISSE